MEVRFRDDVQQQLNQLAADTGRSASDVVQDAVTDYIALTGVRETLASRYDDVQSGATRLLSPLPKRTITPRDATLIYTPLLPKVRQ